MYQEFYSNSNHLIWPLVGLVIFVMIFLCVLGYVIFALRDKDRVSELAGLPLEFDSGTDTTEPDHATGLDHATGRAS